MSTITATSTATSSTPDATATATRVPTWRSGLTTGVAAAVVVTAVALALRAVGVPLEVDGEPIPVLAFAQMVLLGTVIGIVVARRLSRPTFVRATVFLTVASCIPSVVLATGADSKLGLVLTHVVAAAIVVPRLARQQRA